MSALGLLLGIVLFIVIGVDIAFAMGLAALVFLVFGTLPGPPVPLSIIPQGMMNGANSFPLMAVPMFILAGELMNRGGVTVRLARFASALVGNLPGGLAQVVVVVNVIMAGMSGSAVADAAGTGSVLIPAMKSRGYRPAFAGAITAAASTIGPIIPPSIPFVVFGGVASVSVGRLFLGGAVPGLLMGVFLMATIFFLSGRQRFPREPRTSLSVLAQSTKDAALALVMPAIIMGGILFGVATPTEVASLAVWWAVVLGVFVFHELDLKGLVEAFADAAVTTAAIMVTVGAAAVVGWLAARLQLGPMLARNILALSNNPVTVLLLVNVALLILGIVLEPVPLILVVAPILLPVVAKLGVDPVHFGVVFVLNTQIALLTPLVGLCLFTVSSIARVPIMELFMSVRPFGIALIVVLLLITLVPGTVTWLPNLVMGMAR